MTSKDDSVSETVVLRGLPQVFDTVEERAAWAEKSLETHGEMQLTVTGLDEPEIGRLPMDLTWYESSGEGKLLYSYAPEGIIALDDCPPLKGME